MIKLTQLTVLGRAVFAISQLTPSINADLIVKSDDGKKTLLAWRDDDYYGPAGMCRGVIRFKENCWTVSTVAKKELKRELSRVEGPVGFHEMFNQTRDVRGHFISFVYEVTLPTPLAEDQIAGESPRMANVSGLMNVLKILFPTNLPCADIFNCEIGKPCLKLKK